MKNKITKTRTIILSVLLILVAFSAYIVKNKCVEPTEDQVNFAYVRCIDYVNRQYYSGACLDLEINECINLIEQLGTNCMESVYKESNFCLE
jgi:hypothetical protein